MRTSYATCRHCSGQIKRHHFEAFLMGDVGTDWHHVGTMDVSCGWGSGTEAEPEG